jgi:hypothetical protein
MSAFPNSPPLAVYLIFSRVGFFLFSSSAENVKLSVQWQTACLQGQFLHRCRRKIYRNIPNNCFRDILCYPLRYQGTSSSTAPKHIPWIARYLISPLHVTHRTGEKEICTAEETIDEAKIIALVLFNWTSVVDIRLSIRCWRNRVSTWYNCCTKLADVSVVAG